MQKNQIDKSPKLPCLTRRWRNLKIYFWFLIRNKGLLFFTLRSKTPSKIERRPNVIKDHNSYPEDSSSPWRDISLGKVWGGEKIKNLNKQKKSFQDILGILERASHLCVFVRVCEKDIKTKHFYVVVNNNLG